MTSNIDDDMKALMEREGISASCLEDSVSGALDDDELSSISGGSCGKSDTYSCPVCGTPLTWVNYHDSVDNTSRAYYLCYGCRKYGAKLDAGTLWPLPDNFVSWILDKAVKM